MKFSIKNRWSGEIIFTAEIEATDETPLSIKLGLAVKAAVETEANLSWADLSWADLSWADLSEANLSWANLSWADLSWADLSWADLRSFKADFWMILTQNRAEVPALINALCDGKINGSVYRGECACLMGTIANIKHVDVGTLERDSSRPAENWFLMIKEGDKPGDETGGGFAARTAVEWATEWCALNGIKSALVP